MLGPCYVKAAQYQYLRVLNSLFTGSLIKLLPTLSPPFGNIFQQLLQTVFSYLV